MRVLLVDDSVTVRERLKGLFSEVPKVEIIGEAGDGTEALESVRRLNPEVLILDIQMPDGGGIELLQKVKAINRSLTVIVLTNLSDRQYRRKCLDAGADYFFDKSSEFNEVAGVLGGK
jgi:DNA-binding NarL/FixJ family response regulator